MARYTAAAFIGSLLLFLVQPMLGRTMLPMFGGSAAVWGVCLAAYQVLLLGGYLYAHFMSRQKLAVQCSAHLPGLAAAAVWVAAFAFFRHRLAGWISADASAPWLKAGLCVPFFIGIPYLLLSAGSTLVQTWAARHHAGVYRLYAWSNAGSFIGLLAYPLVFEPFLGLTAQWLIFAGGILVYAALLFWLGRSELRSTALSAATEPPPEPLRPEAEVWTWYALPAVTAFALNAVVAHLFMDVTPLPMVWAIALAAFLLSYSLGFSGLAQRWIPAWSAGALLALVAAAYANGLWGTGSFWPNALAGLGVLVLSGTMLHGWLYAERPEPARLTRYYLAIAVGGAVGGLLASFAAPLVFKRVTEYPLALAACCLLIVMRLLKRYRVPVTRSQRLAICLIAALAFLGLVGATARKTNSNVITRRRNFYGTLSVTRTLEISGKSRLPVTFLWYGQTTHGLQVNTPLTQHYPYSYYTHNGGGAGVLSHPRYEKLDEGMKVGVVGLGAGVLACYGRKGDIYRFYEINPQVVEIAQNPRLFTFLNDSYARVDLVLGDARTMMEVESKANDPKYDVLYIDAYSGDSIPYHLITREAFRLYLDRLEPDGILALHVSNWHIDLLPICKSFYEEFSLYPYGTISRQNDNLIAGAVWVYFTRDIHRYIKPDNAVVIDWSRIKPFPLPTDERGSLLPLMRLK